MVFFSTIEIYENVIIFSHFLQESFSGNKKHKQSILDYEMVIAEKENIESALGVATEQSEGSRIKIMYNAVTINQNYVSHFTYDKKVSDFIFYFQLFALIILIFISLIIILIL